MPRTVPRSAVGLARGKTRPNVREAFELMANSCRIHMPTVKMSAHQGENGMYGKWLPGCSAAALIAWSSMVEAGTLDRLRQDNTIRIAYRRDAPHFPITMVRTSRQAFSVDLCRSVAKRVAQQVNVPSLDVAYVPVTAADRFDVISQGKSRSALRGDERHNELSEAY